METQYKTIIYQNKEVKILQYLSESNNQFNQRLEFIKKLDNANTEWKEAQKLSKIWHNITFKKCRYPQELYNKIINI
jgi:hypothetical protein